MIAKNKIKELPTSWDFRNEDTKFLTHCYHKYPAMMIPQIARNLISNYGSNSKDRILFDPFCGSGTTMVEGLIAGYKVIGTDLNPLARLLAKAKCSPVQISDILLHVKYLAEFMMDSILLKNTPAFKNIEYWFSKKAIYNLNRLKEFVDCIENEKVKRFFQVAFSETVRESSLTKSGEFKLVRRKLENIENYNPDVFRIFNEIINRNIVGLKAFNDLYSKLDSKPDVYIGNFNTVELIPEDLIEKCVVELVVTSPPYGDSHTTVAYGQFSRLSSQWLGISDDIVFAVDKNLMGGGNGKVANPQCFDIPQLDAAITFIRSKNEKRAAEVTRFYEDYEKSCANVGSVVKRFGYACYVVSNRRVQGMTLPTDVATIEFFRRQGFEHKQTFERSIPNKRMPSKNSPSNVPGVVDSTMTKENIIVLQKYN